MAFDAATRIAIFKKTDGRCHICRKKLCFNNYGIHGARGAWHVEHSKARANGGTDHLNNLYPACIGCNLDKGTYCVRTARSWNGQTNAPLSSAKKEEIRRKNAVAGGVIGGLIGAVGGPVGAIVLGIVGAAVGKSINPEN